MKAIGTMKICLQFDAATVFTFLTAILVGMFIAILYSGNRGLALRTAQTEMIAARSQSVDSMLASIRETGHAVTSAVRFIRAFPRQARSPLAGMMCCTRWQTEPHTTTGFTLPMRKTALSAQYFTFRRDHDIRA